MTKKQNLSLSKVKKASKEIDEKVQHIIEEGMYKGEQLTFQPIFDDVNVEDLINEFGELMVEAEEKDITISESMQIYLIQLLIIKYFTHFKKDLSNKLIGDSETVGLLDVLEHFRKTGLLQECFDNVFSPVEVSKVYNRLVNFTSNGLLAIDLNEKITEKLSQLKIKNKDIFEQVAKLDK